MDRPRSRGTSSILARKPEFNVDKLVSALIKINPGILGFIKCENQDPNSFVTVDAASNEIKIQAYPSSHGKPLDKVEETVKRLGLPFGSVSINPGNNTVSARLDAVEKVLSSKSLG